MNDLETLNALFDAAGLGPAKNDFEPGTLKWQPRTTTSRDEAMSFLREAVAARATGWILFVDRSAAVEGQWSASWNDDHPLEAELALPGDKAYRLTSAGDGWILAEATIDREADGILEHATHRLLGGASCRHLVAWNADPESGRPLTPRSCAAFNPDPS